MNSASAGITLAVIVAGWPLYHLVTAGDLDLTTAVVRGGVVAAGCALGVGWVVRLANEYEDAARRDKRRKLDSLFSDMEDAMVAGALVEEASSSEASGDGGETGATGETATTGAETDRPAGPAGVPDAPPTAALPGTAP